MGGQAPASSRYAHIDSLRAIAALLVVLTHAAEIFVVLSTNGVWIHRTAWALDLGRAGVVTFFAISGFVIPASLTGERWAGAKRFLIRRLLRLYPAYWLSIPAGVATAWWMPGIEISKAAILANFTMVQKALGFPDVQGLYWTLETELIFYAVCLALFLAGQLHRAAALRTGVVLFAAMFPAAYYAEWRIASFVCLHMAIMLWGALWRKWQNGESIWVLDRWLAWAFPAGWTALALASPLVNAGLRRFIVSYAIGLAIFVLGTTWVRIGNRMGSWLGEISYSIYLFHPPVVYTLVWLMQRAGLDWFFGGHIAVYIAASMALTVALAAIVYRFVEGPAIALGKRLTSGAER